MAEKVQIIIEAKDNASNVLKGIGSSLDSVKKNTLAFSAAFTGIVGGAGLMAKAAADFKVLDDSFKRTTSQMNINSDDLIKSLQKASKGAISNNDLILAANKAMALGVGKDIDGMTTLLEVARIKGQKMGVDMTQAFDDIVTGLGRGSPMILDNLGITIKLGETYEKAAAAVGKTVDQLTDQEKKQALINAVVSQGKEELAAAGDVQATSAEKMQALAAQWQNFTVVMGEAFLPIMDKVVAILAKAIDWFSGMSEETQTVIVGVAAFAAGVTGLLAGLGILLNVLPAVGAALGVLFSPLGLIAAAVAALGLAWSTNFLGIRDKTQAVWNYIKPILDRVSAYLSEHLPPIIESLKAAWGAAWEAMKASAEAVWNFLQPALEFFFKTFKASFDFWLAIFKGDWSGAWEAMKTELSLYWEAIKGILNLLWEGVKSIFDAGIAVVVGLWDAFWGNVSTATQVAIDGILGVVGGMVDWIGEKIGWVLDTIRGAKDAVGNYLSSVAERASGPYQVPGAQFAMGGIAVGGFKAFANGGIVSSPTLGLVGEGRYNEAVVPLPDGRRIPVEMRGGSGITVNINNPSVRDDRDIDTLAQRVGAVLARQLNLHDMGAAT